MAIAFGTAATAETQTGGSSTLDLNLTLVSADDYLVAAVSVDYNGSVSSVVLDPGGGDEANFTQQVTQFGATSARTEIWTLYGANVPAAGTYTVRATISTTDALVFSVLPMQGAAQEAPEATGSNSETSSTNPNVDITTVTDGAVVVDAHGYFSSSFSNSADDGQTELHNEGGSGISAIAGYSTVATAGAINRSWTTGSGDWDSVAAAFAPASGGDTTAPTLSSASASATGATTADASVTSDEAGTGDCVWTTSATAPSGPQIQAGTDENDVAAAASDLNVTLAAPGTVSFSATGLTQGTEYYAHMAVEDAAGNVAVATAGPFTTPNLLKRLLTEGLYVGGSL